MSDEDGSITNLPKLFEDLVIESIMLIKEAVLAIDNREDDILEEKTAKTNTEFLIQKVLSAFAFALENAATENYYSNQTDIPPDSRRLLYCLNNSDQNNTKYCGQTKGSFQKKQAHNASKSRYANNTI